MVPYFAAIRISIHALREEGDRRGKGQHRCRADFYPRPPRGGRHGKPRPWRKHHLISIHALREEGDLRSSIRATSRPLFLSTPSARRATPSGSPTTRTPTNFYPRPPRGGRRRPRRQAHSCGSISIHALREEGDQPPRIRGSRPRISIHALREEGDHPGYNIGELLGNFYPRPPRGGRLL